ncbi:MAG: aspartate/glutamate racemase family protein [Heliobacteriaceae bacterium]|jgi:aspartate racemase|nr:aspartate/glutamate racemase family protein [Heliobacteriaceae bacterium]
MKTIGLIGGMSWESTIEYYRIINQETNRILGGLHSAKILMESYDFAQIAYLQENGRWDELSDILTDSARKLVNNGADFLVIATNTMHKLAPQIEQYAPVFHIADVTAQEALKNNFTNVLLLGTKYTLQEDFYKERLAKHGVNAVLPTLTEQDEVHRIIFDELCKGIISENSCVKLNAIIDSTDAQAVVLGCTELPNIIKTASIPVLNTAEIHSKGIVNYALEGALCQR